ncbi:Uncharacterized protein Rs2_20626 [Raphanus sativus]|nr:Uncharacterized protein Rs2_20626 [Raphanus sativus]
MGAVGAAALTLTKVILACKALAPLKLFLTNTQEVMSLSKASLSSAQETSFSSGIMCAAETLPSAHSIAKLGHWIQNLHEASMEVTRREKKRIPNTLEGRGA